MEYRARGQTYEQFTIGDRFVTPSRTVTEADIVNFAGLSGDFNPLHIDEVFARKTPFGTRIAHGMLVAAMATGMGNWLGILEGTVIALMEQFIQYKAPTRAGDTVHLEMEVVDKKETSKPDRGIIVFSADVINQEGKAVVEGRWTLMMKRE